MLYEIDIHIWIQCIKKDKSNPKKLQIEYIFTKKRF